MGEDDEHLVSAAALEFERGEVAGDGKFFALVDDGSGDSHGVVELAELGCGEVVGLEEVLDEAWWGKEYFLKLLNCSVGLVW